MSDDDFSLSDSPRFARSGHSNDGGKLTRRLDVPVSEELEEAVIALAAIAGVPRAEFARRLLERAVYGDLGMLRMGRTRAQRRSMGRISERVGRAVMPPVAHHPCGTKMKAEDQQVNEPRLSRRQARLIESVIASIVAEHGSSAVELAPAARQLMTREFEEINRLTSRLSDVWPFRR